MKTRKASTHWIALLISGLLALGLSACSQNYVDLPVTSPSSPDAARYETARNFLASHPRTQLYPGLQTLLNSDIDPYKSLEFAVNDSEKVVLLSKSDAVIDAYNFIKSMDDKNIQINRYNYIWQSSDEEIRASFPSPKNLSPMANAEVAELIEKILKRKYQARLASEKNDLASNVFSSGLIAQNGSSGNDCNKFNKDGIYYNYPSNIWKLKNYISSVKSQGDRGTCWAFTAVGMLESKVMLTENYQPDLSEQYFIYRNKIGVIDEKDEGSHTSETIRNFYNSKYAMPDESWWKYNASSVKQPGDAPCIKREGWLFSKCVEYDWSKVHNGQGPLFNDVLPVEFKDGPGEIADALDEGYTVGLSFNTHYFADCSKVFGKCLLPSEPVETSRTVNGKVYPKGYVVESASEDVDQVGGHAVAIVGYISNVQLKKYAPKIPEASGDGYYIIKNSWGCNTGDSGYYYFPDNYVRKYAYSAFRLDFSRSNRVSSWTGKKINKELYFDDIDYKTYKIGEKITVTAEIINSDSLDQSIINWKISPDGNSYTSSQSFDGRHYNTLKSDIDIEASRSGIYTLTAYLSTDPNIKYSRKFEIVEQNQNTPKLKFTGQSSLMEGKYTVNGQIENISSNPLNSAVMYLRLTNSSQSYRAGITSINDLKEGNKINYNISVDPILEALKPGEYKVDLVYVKNGTEDIIPIANLTDWIIKDGLSSVTITCPNLPQVKVGSTRAVCTATATAYDGAHTKDVTNKASFKFTSVVKGIATIDNPTRQDVGEVTGVSAGNAYFTVTGTWNGQSLTSAQSELVRVISADPTLADIVVACPQNKLVPLNTMTCTAKGVDGRGDPLPVQPQFTFQSSDSNVASVNPFTGEVTGKAQGVTTITASAVVNGQTVTSSAGKSFALTVKPVVDPATLGWAQITVTNVATRQPLSGVTFQVCSSSTACQSVPAQETATGVYSLTLPEGLHNLVVSRTGFRTAHIEGAEIVRGQTTILERHLAIDATITGDGVVTGRLVSAVQGDLGLNGVTLTVREGLQNKTNPVFATTMTSSTGEFSLTLPTGYYTVQASAPGYTDLYFNVSSVGGMTQTQGDKAMSPIMPTSGDWRVVLNWGASPSDLDSHLTGPTSTNGKRFHIFWSSKSYSDASTNVNLDWDDRSSYGPETITVKSVPGGLLRYSVHNYSNRGSSSPYLSNSGAKVSLYRGGILVKVFNVPSGEGDLWTVFTLDLTNPVQPLLTPVNSITTVGGSINVQSLSTDKQPINIP